MSTRETLQPLYNGRPVKAPGLMRHGPFPGSDSAVSHKSLELLEDKLAVQTSDIEKLARENHKLATAHVTLRQELVAAENEIQTVRAHIRSIQTESDIQTRVLLDKIAKMEASIEAGEGLKKDLQQAHMEAQSLVKDKQELTFQIQQATQELNKAESDIKNLPNLHAELEDLRKEHQRLRGTFEHEKGRNIEQVEQMKATEMNLISLAREVERLRAEVLNVEKRAYAPNAYGGTYVNLDPSYPPHMPGANDYVDMYGRSQVAVPSVAPGDSQIPHSIDHALASTGTIAGVAAPIGSSAAWEATFDPSIPRR
ncbi:protein FLX-like 4 [Benincasa hispida]|uniref:protein FLX-like 4 n=1 Tax=Benincasa hispida TaxID=102211 RepID=UPI001901E055|nr:protein FLX-like 4 [Benincasa hispida]